ncbi:MAG: MarR family transcriptional regulator [Alphaproteobacteria bacterium]|nr:MarR family transcriptional regulator [Alphaproteobacteria bacterium]
MTSSRRPDLTDTTTLDEALAYRVLRLARRLRYDLACVLQGWDAGLSPEQFAILFRLHERDGRIQRELGDAVLDDRPNITRQVHALVERGLVERRVDPDDGRSRRVHLTAAGRAFFDDLLPQVVARRRALFGDVDAADLAAFARVLDGVEARLVDGVPPDPT